MAFCKLLHSINDGIQQMATFNKWWHLLNGSIKNGYILQTMAFNKWWHFSKIDIDQMTQLSKCCIQHSTNYSIKKWRRSTNDSKMAFNKWQCPKKYIDQMMAFMKWQHLENDGIKQKRFLNRCMQSFVEYLQEHWFFFLSLKDF